MVAYPEQHLRGRYLSLWCVTWSPRLCDTLTTSFLACLVAVSLTRLLALCRLAYRNSGSILGGCINLAFSRSLFAVPYAGTALGTTCGG